MHILIVADFWFRPPKNVDPKIPKKNHRMANLGLIEFKIGLYIKVNVTAGLNKFEVHIYQFVQNGYQLAQNRPDVNFHPILTLFFSNARFLKTNRMVTITKLYFLKFRFWSLPQFLLRGLTWAVLHVWTQNYPQNAGTCPGLPLQLLARNHFFQSDRPEPTHFPP